MLKIYNADEDRGIGSASKKTRGKVAKEEGESSHRDEGMNE